MSRFTSKVIDMRACPASILALMVALAFPVAAASIEQAGLGGRAASTSGGYRPLPTSGGYVSMVAPGTPTNVVMSVFEEDVEWAAASGMVRTDGAGAFDVYVLEARAHVIIDVIGYFAPPKN